MTMQTGPVGAVSFEEIEKARERIRDDVIRLPLIPLNLQLDEKQIYLKLENLQAIGCFKIRGASNAIRCLTEEALKNGVYTCSVGNFAQGLAYCSKRLNIPCEIFVPDSAPEAKLAPVRRMGGVIHRVTFDDWWNIVLSHKYEGMTGRFIHPVSDKTVIAGNGTCGIEIFEDLPEVDTVIIPYGGGGLSCGIASALRHLKPSCKVYASEIATAAPLHAAMETGKPTKIAHTPSFVDGIGSGSVLEEMWPMVKDLLVGSIPVSLQEVADAIKLLAEKNHVIAEGAGASSLAAALGDEVGSGNIVCVISGGNIDSDKLVKVLRGEIPEASGKV